MARGIMVQGIIQKLRSAKRTSAYQGVTVC